MVPPSRELAGLLAAIGRGSEASEVLAEVWGRDELRRERGTAMPAELLRPASLFLVLAALGVCGDTLARLEQRVRDLVAVRVPESDRAAVLSQSLVAPLKLSAHCDRFRPARRAGETDDPLLPLQRLAADGRFGAVQKRLEELAAERRAVAVADVSVDQSVQEALLLVATGDSASARARLVAALDGVSSSSSFTLSEVAQAAALGMGRLLLADLARGASPPTAARARAELRTLWREGEGTKRP